MATQGRSLWIIDDLSILHQLNSVEKDQDHLFKPKPSYRLAGRSRESSTAGTNHPAGVMTYFFLKDPEGKEVKISYLNSDNDTIQSFSSVDDKNKLQVSQGANQHVWDMRGKGAETLDGMILWWASTDAPQAVPGNYKVVMEVDDKVYKQDFQILADANAETDQDGIQQQFDFISSVNTTVDNAHQSIKKMRMVDAQLKDFQKQYQNNEQVKPLLEKAKNLSEQISAIENALYQTKNRSNQDPLNFPIKLTNKLAHLNSLVGMDDFPPTKQDIQVKEELTASIKEELNKFDQLLQQEVKEFNKEFNAMDLNYLFVETKD